MKKEICELVQIFMDRDEMALDEAEFLVNEMREAVKNGENPEQLLYDEGLEPDYIFDIL